MSEWQISMALIMGGCAVGLLWHIANQVEKAQKSLVEVVWLLRRQQGLN